MNKFEAEHGVFLLPTSTLMPSDIYHQDIHASFHEETTPSSKKVCKVGHEIVAAFLCCVVGIIMFSLIINKDAWYWGVIAGIGGYSVLRAFYGCYMNDPSTNHAKSPGTTLTAHVEVVVPPPYLPHASYTLDPIYEEDPTPPTV